MLLLHDRAKSRDVFGMLRGDVGGFGGVVGKIVQLDFARRLVLGAWQGIEVRADRLEIADADALLAAVAGGFAIQEWTRRLIFGAEQRRREGDSIDVVGREIFD